VRSCFALIPLFVSNVWALAPAGALSRPSWAYARRYSEGAQPVAGEFSGREPPTPFRAATGDLV